MFVGLFAMWAYYKSFSELLTELCCVQLDVYSLTLKS